APTLTFRIHSDATGWGGTTRPAALALFDLIAVAGQYDSSAPYDSSYQLIARCDRQGDGTVAYNGNADTGPDVMTAGTLPVELSVFSSE
ncbi:hypothetical protein JXA47_06730, partial [Candidatus Sumerlaeota bacterium]|nr:hypothetical protein [Candidatus Sumerlaeota bacterium]